LCIYAKGFMTSRLEEAWSDIKSLGLRCWPTIPRAHPKLTLAVSQDSFRSHMKGLNTPQVPSATFQDDMVRQFSSTSTCIWTSFVHLIVSILENVRVNDHMSEDIMTLLFPAVFSNAVAKEALGAYMPDSFWLALWRFNISNADANQTALLQEPKLTKPSDTHWKFVSIMG